MCVVDVMAIKVLRLTEMQIARNGMTVSTCLEFCSTGKNGRAMQYAGLDHGMACMELVCVGVKLRQRCRS